MAYKRNLSFPLAPTFGDDDKKKKTKKKTTRTVKGMKVDNKEGSDNITKRGTLTSRRRGVGTASTSTKSSDSTSGLKKTKTKKAPKAKKTKIEKITDRAKRRGHNPDYYVTKYTDKQKEKERKKAAKEKQKADFEALSPEEKEQARKNTRQKRTGKIKSIFPRKTNPQNKKKKCNPSGGNKNCPKSYLGGKN